MMDDMGVRNLGISCLQLTNCTRYNPIHSAKSRVDKGNPYRLKLLKE